MLRLRAPAKLNLYLRVLGRRPDGYHEIETIFERVDLADELTFEEHPSELRLTCTEPRLSCRGDNLILQAARVLQQASGTSRGASIHLLKRIPIAAGLGGGSSDAAATLIGLNQLWDLQVSAPALAQLAARLGSDVPFFLITAPFAIGRGRGEACEPIPGIPPLAHVLVVSDVQLATRDIYAGARFDLTAPKPSLRMVEHALRNGPDLAGLAKGLWNDLAPEAIRRCPVIATIQARLRHLGCLRTCVSGSGPSVFGLCRDAVHAQAVARGVRPQVDPSWRIEVVHTDQPHHESVTDSLRHWGVG
ncbi:MAG: 4-(cytidine 5'-diphospho)-2-C-methyl-D-erythritol kinase [Candidatus Omnitrophota bacterium]|nr:4-(cytidine 5'-diphospho)-2-C-methyl-D-erythritol kinase [Candidatus Omnitrophota bacterium]